MTGSPAPTLSPRLVWITVSILLAGFAAACLQVARGTSPTFDEPDQLATGYHALKWFGRSDPDVAGTNMVYFNQDLRFTQMWEALPLLAFKTPPHFPTLAEQQAAPGSNFGRIFMFDPRNDTEAMVFASRAMVVLLSVVLGLVIFLWSRRLWGDAAGLVALALYCLNPLVIAHSSVATTDIITTLFYTLAAATLWRLLHRLSVGNLLLAGVVAGVLGACKISSVLLLPAAGIMLLVRMLGKRPLETRLPFRREISSRPPSWLLLLGALAAAVVVAYVTVWALYGFRYPIADVAQAAEWKVNSTLQLGFAGPLIQFFRDHRLLPEAYLFDLHLFSESGSLRRAFLMGEYSLNGWWYFFPVAFLVKTPLPLLLALTAALAVAWRQRREQAENFYRLAPLLALGAVYGAATLASNLNIGVRHLLPLHPLLLIFAGGLLTRLPLPTARARAVCVGALLAWSAIEVAAVHPHHLAYFNELAGGPAQGHRFLVDSSYEWGEDLPAMQRWMQARAAHATKDHPAPPIFFSYFGCADLTHYGIQPITTGPAGPSGNVVQLPSFYDQRPTQPYDLAPGTYVISVTMQKSLYSAIAFGPWRPSTEAAYQDISKNMARLREAMTQAQTIPSALNTFLEREGRAVSPADTAEQARARGTQIWLRNIQFHDDLRFSRLCAYLRGREPEERIGYSLLVYELSATELAQAINGPPKELRLDNAIKTPGNLPPDKFGILK